MEEKSSIKKIYINKIKEIKKHNEIYFSKNKSLITDKEYDELKYSILELEKKYNYLNHKDSPSKNVGFKPSKNFKKQKHKVPMLSLSNIFNKEDLENFEKKIKNYLDFNQIQKFEYSVEPKIDGISASLTYVNGNLELGVSRGDGYEGELITENLKTINDIPKKINLKGFPKNIEIRGEVYINKSDFENLKEKFANPRNAASGSLRQKVSSETKKIPLKFVAPEIESISFSRELLLASRRESSFLADSIVFSSTSILLSIEEIKFGEFDNSSSMVLFLLSFPCKRSNFLNSVLFDNIY